MDTVITFLFSSFLSILNPYLQCCIHILECCFSLFKVVDDNAVRELVIFLVIHIQQLFKCAHINKLIRIHSLWLSILLRFMGSGLVLCGCLGFGGLWLCVRGNA